MAAASTPVDTVGLAEIGRATRRAGRRRQWKAFGLTLPLAAFLLVFFLLPIFGMLQLAVSNAELGEVMPDAAAALGAWDGDGLPDGETARTVAADLRRAFEARALGEVAARLNNEVPGYRSMLMGTARKLPETIEGDALAALADIDPVWREPSLWRLLKRTAAPYTDLYLLQALDLERGAGGDIRRRPAEQAVYLDILWRTLEISLFVTLACLVLAYPLAYKLASLKEKHANLLMIFVLLPFWTSLLVRSAAWIVLLQREGPINDGLIWLGLIDTPLSMVFNRTGVLIAMTHVLLPFMVLPLYSVMKGISPTYLRAAVSLGCPPFKSYWKVYFPMTVPGVAAGGLLVFIISMGYYITPALLGSPKEQMASYFVAFYTNETTNWGMAAALSAVLLVATMILYFVYNRLVGSASAGARPR